MALLLDFVPLSAQTLRQAAMPIHAVGLAIGAADFFFWGDGLHRYRLPFTTGARPDRIASGKFLEGGCAMDVDWDGRTDLVPIDAAGDKPSLILLEAHPDSKHPLSKNHGRATLSTRA